MATTKTTRKSVGALWAHESKAGEGYYRGFIELEGRRVQIVAFDNSFYKKGERSPDVSICVHEPLEVA